MSKRKRRGQEVITHSAAPSSQAEAVPALPVPPGAEVFSFGDPTPVLDRAEILDYIECWTNGRYYEPPISWDGLAKSFRASVHHSTAIYVKRNLLAAMAARLCGLLISFKSIAIKQFPAFFLISCPGAQTSPHHACPLNGALLTQMCVTG